MTRNCPRQYDPDLAPYEPDAPRKLPVFGALATVAAVIAALALAYIVFH